MRSGISFIRGFRFVNLLPILILIQTACMTDDNEVEEEIMGYNYFPLELGNYRIYEVTEINYTVQEQPDTTVYFLKELIADTSRDQTGQKIHYIYTYRRDDPFVSWEKEPVTVMVARQTRSNLVITENNISFVRMIFPVKAGKSWDGNAFNTFEAMFYHYISEDIQSGSAATGSGNRIRVIRRDYDDGVIRRDVCFEIYAENTGMVYRESSALEYCQDVSCLGEEKIESGREIFQQLIEYGQE